MYIKAIALIGATAAYGAAAAIAVLVLIAGHKLKYRLTTLKKKDFIITPPLYMFFLPAVPMHYNYRLNIEAVILKA